MRLTELERRLRRVERAVGEVGRRFLQRGRLRRVEPMPRSRAEAIARLRQHCRALGCPIEDMTDEEVERGVERVARLTARMGVPAAEFADRFGAVCRAMNQGASRSVR